MKIKRNILLCNMTTMKVGGRAEYYSTIKTKEDLEEAVLWASKRNLSVTVIGDGSNVVVSDEGVCGVVIKLTNTRYDILKTDSSKSTVVVVGAGYNWDKVVDKAVRRGFQGIECLSGIPGTIGAAPIQNIGAYGQELKDVFVELVVFDTVLEKFSKLSKKDCKFGYRTSIFKTKSNKDRYIIFEVVLKLYKNTSPIIKYPSLKKYFISKKINDPSLEQTRKAVLGIRKQKLEDPSKVPNAGSFFKNPVITKKDYESLKSKHSSVPGYEIGGKVKLSAGWLIEQLGWKGKMVGNVGVSSKHALVLINPEKKGTSKEIKRLAEKIQKDVKEEFGVNLLWEVQYLN